MAQRLMGALLQSFLTLLAPKKNPDISDIELDSGVVLQKGPNKGYKVALYKDSKGKTEEFSALCPHLGCQLQVTHAVAHILVVSLKAMDVVRCVSEVGKLLCKKGS